MVSGLTGLDRGMVSLRAVFFVLVALEITTLCFVLFGELETKILYAAILLVPLLIVIIPLEPNVGIAIMVLTSGLDFLGVIAEDTSAQYMKFTYFHIATLITFVSAAMNLILQKKTTIPSIDIWPPLIFFLVMYALSLTRTPYINDALFTMARVFMLSLVVVVIVLHVNKPWKVLFVTGAMIAAPLTVAVITLYQLYTEGTFFAPIVIKVANAIGLPVFRSTGTFRNPNNLACYLMIGVTLVFSMMFIRSIPKLTRTLLVTILVVITLGLIASFSRGGWVSTMCAMACIVAFHKRWLYFGYLAIFVLICVLIVSIKVPNLWEVVFERFGTIFNAAEDASSVGRIALIKSSIWMWMDYPIFGVGLRGFPVLFPEYIDPSMPHVLTELREAHTIQTEILAEFGIIGIVISTWLFFTILFHGYRSFRTMKSDILRCIEIGLVSLFLGFIVNFTFATDITNNVFWMDIGLIYALPLVDRAMTDTTAEPSAA